MTPLQLGAPLPPLTLDRDGRPFDQTSILGSPSIFYFMRSATCGICLGHVKRISKKLAGAEQKDTHVFVVVPGGPEEARQVAGKVPFPVLSGTKAHEAVGLGRRLLGAVQGSGTLLLDREGRALFFKHGTLQTQAYDEKGLFRALAAA